MIKMYKAYWEMQFNPFEKNNSFINKNILRTYETKDYTNAKARLNHLTKIKGIGLFTGLSGTGKTFTLKQFSDSLNKNLYKVIYIPLSTVTVLEFYKALAYGLDLDPEAKKIELFRQIQDRIINLSKDKKMTPIFLLDEVQYMKTAVLNDLKLLFNFEMDSKNYAVVILAGQPVLNNILSKQVHEALKQRIVINYNFEGIGKEETKNYIITRLQQCGASPDIFEDTTYEALHGCCNGSIRKLNTLLSNCLLIGCMNKVERINTDVVMAAQNEVELI